MLVPGLVNAHCHLELSYLKGCIEPNGGFAGFADAIARVRHNASADTRHQAAVYWDARMAYDGVVAVGDVCNGTSTFRCKQSSTIHYHNFIEGFGLKNPDFSPLYRAAESSEEFGFSTSITPHSTYSLQDAAWRELSQAGNPLSIHFMESRGEQELFHRQGSLYARNLREGIDVDFIGYGSPTQRILASIPSGKKVLLIHNTCVSQSDIEAIQQHFGEGVTWVLCPGSNRFIEGMQPPASLLHRLGVRVAIGTDSLASNQTLTLLDELKLLPDIPLPERLKWATLNGAQALGIDSWAGSFEVGKHPGATLITGVDWENLTLKPDAASRRIL